MPNATLAFQLPEEQQEHLDALQGSDWKLLAWRLQQHLFRSQKDGKETLSIEELFDFLNAEAENLKLHLE